MRFKISGLALALSLGVAGLGWGFGSALGNLQSKQPTIAIGSFLTESYGPTFVWEDRFAYQISVGHVGRNDIGVLSIGTSPGLNEPFLRGVVKEVVLDTGGRNSDSSRVLARWHSQMDTEKSETSESGTSSVNVRGGRWIQDPQEGRVLRFNGEDDYLRLQGNLVQPLLENNRFRVRVLLKHEADGLQRIVCDNRVFSLQVAYGRFVLLAHINGSWKELKGNLPLDSSRWYAVVGTYDGERLRLEVDGQEDAVISIPGRLSIDQSPVIDGWMPQFNSVTEMGPSAGDWSYNRISWSPDQTARDPKLNRNRRIVLEWSRLDLNTVIGRVTAEGFVPSEAPILTLSSWSPWGGRAEYEVNRNEIQAEGRQVFEKARNAAGGELPRLVILTDPAPDVVSNFSSRPDLRSNLALISSPLKSSNTVAGGRWLRGQNLSFVAAIGQDTSALTAHCQRILQERKIDSWIDEKKARLQARSVRMTGTFAGTWDAVASTLHWNRVYAPELAQWFVIDSRGFITGPDNWTLFCNSSAINSLAASVVDTVTAAKTFHGVLSGQRQDGRVMNAWGHINTPDRGQNNWYGYTLWKSYLWTRDLKSLKASYPSALKFHRWFFGRRPDGGIWRDGNGDGLLELGSDPQSEPAMPGVNLKVPWKIDDLERLPQYWNHFNAAAWESGFDDSPMWGFGDGGTDQADVEAAYIVPAHTMDLNTVDRNSDHTLNAECLSLIASELGLHSEAVQLSQEAETMRQRVRGRLWSEKEGIYLNRFWKAADYRRHGYAPIHDGEFSSRLSPTLLFPMTAGIATPKQAERMVRQYLLNPDKFWGELVVPTISRDDPAFQDQIYWRGSIWAPVCLFVYEGLRRYGYDQEASELARRAIAMYMKDWNERSGSWEYFYSTTGKGGGFIHYSWAVAIPLLGIYEYLDVEPWKGGGLRIGSLLPQIKGTIRNLRAMGHDWEISLGDPGVRVLRDGQSWVETQRPAILKRIRFGKTYLAFRAKTTAGSRFKVSVRDYPTRTVRLNGRPIVSEVQGEFAIFEVPRGEHQITVGSGAADSTN
jgi:hypothetical protein